MVSITPSPELPLSVSLPDFLTLLSLAFFMVLVTPFCINIVAEVLALDSLLDDHLASALRASPLA